MQKLKLQNKYNPQTKSFEKNAWEIREMDKLISGKVVISAKKNNNWISKPISFIAFKDGIDKETLDTLLHNRGEYFMAEFSLSVDNFKDNDGKDIIFHKIVIKKARGVEDQAAKQPEPPQEESDDDSDSILF